MTLVPKLSSFASIRQPLIPELKLHASEGSDPKPAVPLSMPKTWLLPSMNVITVRLEWFCLSCSC